MSPQFVDFNGDGYLDIVTATYDGSPHISYGSKEGFKPPVHLLDDDGKRITLQRWYDFDAKGYKMAENQAKGRLTSALAFDWNGNGVHDLLLGDKEDGYLYLRMNHGTKTEPKFDRKDIPVLAGNKPIKVDGGITSPRLIDMDGDGRIDLLIGSYGDDHGSNPGGAVYWYRNVGKPDAPEFLAPVTLIEPSPKGKAEPTRPDTGLYVDAFDYDGDGYLDLIVGGYSTWTPARPPLDAEQIAKLATLQVQMKEVTQELRDHQSATQEVRTEIIRRRTALQTQISELAPSPQRKPFVWLYRNLGAATTGTR